MSEEDVSIPALKFSFLGTTIDVQTFFLAVTQVGYTGSNNDDAKKTNASLVADLLGIGTSLSGKNMVEMFYQKQSWQAWHISQNGGTGTNPGENI